MIIVGNHDVERPPEGVQIRCPTCVRCGRAAVKTVGVVLGRGEAVAGLGVCEEHIPRAESDQSGVLRVLAAVAIAALEAAG